MKHLNLIFNLLLVPFIFLERLLSFILGFSAENVVNVGDYKGSDSASAFHLSRDGMRKLFFAMVVSTTSLVAASWTDASDIALTTSGTTVNSSVDENDWITYKVTVQTSGTVGISITNFDTSKGTVKFVYSSIYRPDPSDATSTPKTSSETYTHNAGDVFYITVYGDDNQPQSHTLGITLIPPNTSPTANAGADQTIILGSSVTLNGTGTDTDGTIASYEWKEGTNVLANTASFTYAPTTTSTLTLTVTDNLGATGTDTVVITVTSDDTTPTDPIVTPPTILPVNPNFVECGLFPSALNTWENIVNGNGDTVIDSDTVYADSVTGGGDLECTSGGTSDNCHVEEMTEVPQPMPTFLTSPTSGTYTATNTETNASYGDVIVNDGETITFDPSGTYSTGEPVMLMNSLTIGTGATVTFTEGDYWIGSWVSEASINIRTDGKVRLFINGTMDLTQNHVDFNYDGGAGSPANLFIFIYGDFEFASQGGGDVQDLAAYVYVDGTYTANHNTENSHFLGAVTAVGDINLNNNQQYTYDDSGLLDGWGDCGCPTVGFERPEYNIAEDINHVGTEIFVDTHIVLSRVLGYDVTVRYDTEDGTARVADGDYRQQVNQLITIPSGVKKVLLPIGIYNDAPIELDENFFVQLSEQQPAEVCMSDINRTQINIISQEDSPVCFEDHFDNGLDNRWRVLRSSGGYTPAIVDVNGDNRLRLTDKSTNLATTLTKDYELETSANLIIVEFDYYAYGGCGDNGGLGYYGADGIVNILFDTNVGDSPVPGALGGSMGYAQNTNSDGFEGGWLGLGIDEYGNFGNCNEARVGGLEGTSCDTDTGFDPQSYTNTVVIRGDGDARSGYDFLQGVKLSDLGQPSVAALREDNLNDYDSGRYKMTIDARDTAHLYIRLERDIKDGNGYQVLLSRFDAKDPQYNQGITPERVRYAISAGTGGGCNNHEISWIRLKGNCGIYGTPPETGPFDAWDIFRDTTATAPTDRNISTKIVEKPFPLALASLDANQSYYETKPGAGSNIEVAIYEQNGLIPISNIVNFDANTSAHISPSSNFNISQAYQNATVGFKVCATNENDAATGQYIYRLWPVANCSGQIHECITTTNGNPTWHICYSSDNFAIRPRSFQMTAPANPIIGGNGYTIDYTAEDDLGQPTIGYSQTQGGSFDITTALEPAKAGCQNQYIDLNSSIEFHHGFHDGDLNATYFNTIGDFNLSLHEVIGSEFAKVDADDTPFSSSENRLITPYTINNMHIVPSGYRLTTTFTDANNANNFTYLNDINTGVVKTMAAKLNINIQAIIADSTNAENYESDCYSDITDLLVDYNYTEITPANSLNELQYHYAIDPLFDGTDTDIVISSGTDDNTENFTIQDFPATLFKDGDNGQADINLAINFDRTQNIAVNPFKLLINDVNLTENDEEVSSEHTVAQDAHFHYGRAKSSDSDDFYETTGSIMNTPITVLVYCGWLDGAGCSSMNIDTINGQTGIGGWWLSTAHQEANGDGNITLMQGNNIGGGWTLDPDVSVVANAVDTTIDVTNNNLAVPVVVNIDLDTTNPTDTNAWLIYNSVGAVAPFYQVRFLSTAGWAGVGDTGLVLDVNASSAKTKRLNW